MVVNGVKDAGKQVDFIFLCEIYVYVKFQGIHRQQKRASGRGSKVEICGNDSITLTCKNNIAVNYDKEFEFIFIEVRQWMRVTESQIVIENICKKIY